MELTTSSPTLLTTLGLDKWQCRAPKVGGRRMYTFHPYHQEVYSNPTYLSIVLEYVEPNMYLPKSTTSRWPQAEFKSHISELLLTNHEITPFKSVKRGRYVFPRKSAGEQKIKNVQGMLA
jgi:hypothetical protein